MAKSCVVCLKSQQKGDGRSLHIFPKNPILKRKWYEIIGIISINLSTYNYVCSNHFTEDSFVVTLGGKKFLKPEAIPTVSLHETGHISGENVNDKNILTCSICNAKEVDTLYRIYSNDEPTKRWLKSSFPEFSNINFENDIYVCSSHLQKHNETTEENFCNSNNFVEISQIEQPKIRIKNFVDDSSTQIEHEGDPLEVNQQNFSSNDENNYTEYYRLLEETKSNIIRYVSQINEDKILTVLEAERALKFAQNAVKKQAIKLKSLNQQRRKLKLKYNKLKLLQKYQILEQNARKGYINDYKMDR